MSTHSSPERSLDPQEYRDSNEIVPEARLLSAEISIELLPHSRRAKYSYHCHVETGPGAAAEEWQFDIPSDVTEVQQIRAWDRAGGLQFDVLRVDGKGSRLRVRFRIRVVAGTPYEFFYEYVMPTTSIIAKGNLSETVTFLGWSIFLMHCNVLRIAVALPRRASPIETIPAPSSQSTENGSTLLRYERHHLRPLESYLLLVGYRHRKIGMPAFLWLAGAIGTGIVGAVVAAALGLN
jgi:hypothetical protein